VARVREGKKAERRRRQETESLFIFKNPQRVFLLSSKKIIVLQTMMATPPLRWARHTLSSTKHYVTSPSDPPLRLQPSHSPHSCTTRLTTTAAEECTLSNTRVLRSSHNDRSKHDERVSTLAVVPREVLNRRWPPFLQGALRVRQGDGKPQTLPRPRPHHRRVGALQGKMIQRFCRNMAELAQRVGRQTMPR
jgi:hypothetical protein